MFRAVASLLSLALLCTLSACLSSPAAPEGSSPLASTNGTSRLHRETANPEGAGGGILLRSNRQDRWCTCDDVLPVPRDRAGVGLHFTWTVTDPVAVDRFAEFRVTVDGQLVLDWGNARAWPSDTGGNETLWFPSSGMHTFVVEKDLNGLMTRLDAELEILEP